MEIKLSQLRKIIRETIEETKFQSTQSSPTKGYSKTMATRKVTTQNADVARIVDALEKDFLRLRGKPFDETLTLAIVGALRPAAGDLSEFFRGYSTFVATNAAKLEHVFAEYETDYRHLLLGQPESLLIFYLKEHNPSALEEHWPSSVPEKLLDGLGGVWVPADSV